MRGPGRRMSDLDLDLDLGTVGGIWRLLYHGDGEGEAAEEVRLQEPRPGGLGLRGFVGMGERVDGWMGAGVEGRLTGRIVDHVAGVGVGGA